MKVFLSGAVAFLSGWALNASLSGHGEDAGFLGLFLMFGLAILIPVTAVIHAVAAKTKYASLTLCVLIATVFALIGLFV